MFDPLSRLFSQRNRRKRTSIVRMLWRGWWEGHRNHGPGFSFSVAREFGVWASFLHARVGLFRYILIRKISGFFTKPLLIIPPPGENRNKKYVDVHSTHISLHIQEHIFFDAPFLHGISRWGTIVNNNILMFVLFDTSSHTT